MLPAPAAYGPHKTLDTCFVCTSRKGVFDRLFAALAAEGGPPSRLMIDATPLTAHRTAASLRPLKLRKPFFVADFETIDATPPGKARLAEETEDRRIAAAAKLANGTGQYRRALGSRRPAELPLALTVLKDGTAPPSANTAAVGGSSASIGRGGTGSG